MPIDQAGFWIPPETVYPHELNQRHPTGYRYHCAIPEPTTLSPGQLLNYYYSDKANDRDWTDPNGVLCKQQETYRLYPEYAVWPIGSSGLVAHWPRPHGLDAEPVPSNGGGPLASRFHNSVPPIGAEIIEFMSNNQDPECPSFGISLSDIYYGRRESLKGEADVVFGELQGGVMNFVIIWPGYQIEKFNIPSMPGGQPLTRFALAEHIAMGYARLFRKVEDEFVLPSEVGFYNIALHQGEKSKEDSMGVQFAQLYLCRYYYSATGNWVAEMEIV